MKKVILGIGIPGSGKTTVLKAFHDRNPEYAYISPDEIRKELFGDAPFDGEKNQEVWDMAHERVKQALEGGRTVILDSTFANENQRQRFINFVRDNGAERVEGVFVDVPLEIAKERNVARGDTGGKVVPEKIIDVMHNQITHSEPGLIDGFDAIFQLGSNGEMIQTDMFRKEKYLTRKFI